MRVTMKKGKQKNNATTRAGRKEELTAYLCLIPAFLGVTLISYLPTLAVFVLSLFDWNGITKPEFIGLANFQRIFTKDIYFWDSIKATVWYAFLAVIGAVVYSLIIAILLNMNIKGRTLFRSLFFIPYLLPAIGVFKGWEWLYEGNFGLFNFVLRMMGLPKQRFLDDPNQVIPCLVLIAIWTSGNLIVIFLAGLQNVPGVYIEAAKIDGANAWQRFRDVTLPCISPTTFFLLIVTMVNSLQAYDQIQILTQGGPSGSTRTLLYMYYQLGFEEYDMGQATAVAMVLVVITLILSGVQFLASKKWVHY